MKGLTYFKRWGFSINEGRFPNIHFSWSGPFGLYFYCAFRLFKKTYRFHN